MANARRNEIRNKVQRDFEEPAAGKSENFLIDRPAGLEFRDGAQRQAFQALNTMGFDATKYACPTFMQEANIAEDVITLFGRLGMANFILTHWPTYDRIALEFLSSFQIIHIDKSNRGPSRVTFRLYNSEYNLSLGEFNSIFGFPPLNYQTEIDEFDAPAFWKEITGESELRLARAKASLIQNPIFRYMHRILSNTICGRGDSEGAVNETELLFLWAMVENVQLNVGAHLAKTFHKHAKKTRGRIVIGGLVTPIALHFRLYVGCNFKREASLLDQSKMLHMKLIKVRRDRMYFIFRDRKVLIACSDRAQFTILNKANWLLCTPISIDFGEESDSDDAPIANENPDIQRDEPGPSHSEQPTAEEHMQLPHHSFVPPPSSYTSALPTDSFGYIPYQVALDHIRTDQTRYHLVMMNEIHRMHTTIQNDHQRLLRMEDRYQEDHDRLIRMDAEAQEDRARFGRIEQDMHDLLRMFQQYFGVEPLPPPSPASD